MRGFLKIVSVFVLVAMLAGCTQVSLVKRKYTRGFYTAHSQKLEKKEVAHRRLDIVLPAENIPAVSANADEILCKNNEQKNFAFPDKKHSDFKKRKITPLILLHKRGEVAHEKIKSPEVKKTVDSVPHKNRLTCSC